MIRVFINEGNIINVDNDVDAENILGDPLTERELTQNEITTVFGEFAHHAGPNNTQVQNDGSIVFTPPLEYTVVINWIDAIVRPARNEKLTGSDKYMIPDYPISQAAKDQWITWRQELRDFPSTLTAIVDPIPWPEL